MTFDTKTTRLPRPEPKNPSGWLYQGGVWLHAETGCSVMARTGGQPGIRSVWIAPESHTELVECAQALMDLGRFLEAGGRPL